MFGNREGYLAGGRQSSLCGTVRNKRPTWINGCWARRVYTCTGCLATATSSLRGDPASGSRHG